MKKIKGIYVTIALIASEIIFAYGAYALLLILL